MYGRNGNRGNTVSEVKYFLIIVCVKKHSYGQVYRDGGRPSSQEEEALFSNGMECKCAKSLSPWMKNKVMTLGSQPRTEEFPWGFITAATEEQGNKMSLKFSYKALHGFPPAWQGESIQGSPRNWRKMKVLQPFYSANVIIYVKI